MVPICVMRLVDRYLIDTLLSIVHRFQAYRTILFRPVRTVPEYKKGVDCVLVAFAEAQKYTQGVYTRSREGGRVIGVVLSLKRGLTSNPVFIGNTGGHEESVVSPGTIKHFLRVRFPTFLKVFWIELSTVL